MTAANSQEGAEQDITKGEIDDLQDAHHDLNRAIGHAKSVNPLKWKAERFEVETAQRALENEL